ncbi:MAG: glycosyltransferase [Candidatus Omnitrophota bacterium]|jgi:ADP-heptose:LPS heptosyltransferase/glycosyltransferase involved in cell wall biosynthesis
MNILQVVPELNSGGVETGTIDLARQLIGHGHKAVIISNGGRLLNGTASYGIIHYCLPVHEKSLLTVLSMINKIKDIIAKEGIDIVHARSRTPALSAFFAARALNVPFVTTCHGYYSRHLLSRVMGWGKLVIVPSNVVASHMIRDFKVPLHRIRLIPRGVDLARFEFRCPSDKKNKKEFSIAVIGRITPIKGHVYLLRAMSKVARIIPDAKLYIIGTPPASRPKYRQDLESLVKRLSLCAHVEFTGDCDNVAQRLKDIDLLVVPSAGEETFGRVIIEAQASGVPVIASRIGGIVDIIKENNNGILVNPRDYSGLADAMLNVIKDKGLQRRLSDNARAYVERRFTLEGMYDATMKVYKEAKKSFKILVIKWSALGDIILSLTSLKAMREKFPDAKIAFFTTRQGIEIAGRYPYVDEFFVLKNSHFREGLPGLLEAASELRRFAPDLVCDLQNNKKSHLLSFLSCACRRLGYKSKKLDFLMNEAVDGARDILSPVRHQFRLLERLGIDSIPASDPFFVNDKEYAYADELIGESWIGKGQKIVGINFAASGRWQTKRWPVENIARLCDLLAADNIRVFITGVKDDSAQARRVAVLSKSRPFDMTGRTNIMQLVSFIKRCDVFISGDSAPMHIASLCGVSFIALFGPTDPARHFQAVAGTRGNSRFIHKKLKCSPCYKRRCRRMDCMKGITPEEVYGAVKNLLEN